MRASTVRRAKITITVDAHILAEIDQLVADGVFKNRSAAFEEVVQERIAKFHRFRLSRECAKLDRSEEQVLADEG